MAGAWEQNREEREAGLRTDSMFGGNTEGKTRRGLNYGPRVNNPG